MGSGTTVNLCPLMIVDAGGHDTAGLRGQMQLLLPSAQLPYRPLTGLDVSHRHCLLLGCTRRI
jgi:hypothetical protein